MVRLIKGSYHLLLPNVIFSTSKCVVNFATTNICMSSINTRFGEVGKKVAVEKYSTLGKLVFLKLKKIIVYCATHNGVDHIPNFIICYFEGTFSSPACLTPILLSPSR